MCTNRALVETLECYMDNLVCSFEDFVKKSLILITAGLATLVFLLLYMLKIVSERAEAPSDTASSSSSRRRIPNTTRSLTSSSCCPKSCLERDNIYNDYLKQSRKPSTTTCRSANTPPRSTKPSLQTLASISSCKKNCGELKKKSSNKSSRLPIPSLSSCMIKQHLSMSPRPSRNHDKPDETSCCSMCCKDDES